MSEEEIGRPSELHVSAGIPSQGMKSLGEKQRLAGEDEDFLRQCAGCWSGSQKA